MPLVVRLEGTNVDLGKQIMAESGLPIIMPTILQTRLRRSLL